MSENKLKTNLLSTDKEQGKQLKLWEPRLTLSGFRKLTQGYRKRYLALLSAALLASCGGPEKVKFDHPDAGDTTGQNTGGSGGEGTGKTSTGGTIESGGSGGSTNEGGASGGGGSSPGGSSPGEPLPSVQKTYACDEPLKETYLVGTRTDSPAGGLFLGKFAGPASIQYVEYMIGVDNEDPTFPCDKIDHPFVYFKGIGDADAVPPFNAELNTIQVTGVNESWPQNSDRLWIKIHFDDPKVIAKSENLFVGHQSVKGPKGWSQCQGICLAKDSSHDKDNWMGMRNHGVWGFISVRDLGQPFDFIMRGYQNVPMDSIEGLDINEKPNSNLMQNMTNLSQPNNMRRPSELEVYENPTNSRKIAGKVVEINDKGLIFIPEKNE